MVQTGLEILLSERRASLRGRRVGLICHAASVDSTLRHAVDLLFEAEDIELAALFGPQHGLFGDTQDNMIEWGDFRHAGTGVPVFSLYGENRAPTEEAIDRIDSLLFDLQDVGARIYTYAHTMALALRTCAKHGKSFIVLDRPNPINGIDIEGNVLDPEFRSFVGLYPIAIRHGMTLGELALYLNSEFDLGCDLEVISMRGWRRESFFDQTGLPWVMPSPNVPTLDTAVVFPGLCLLEGTNVSEGRGTTRPFEISGAPWIQPDALAETLSAAGLPGVRFRPLHFAATFHKWQEKMIGGIQIHVTDRPAYRPYRTGLEVLKAYRDLGGERFSWNPPPYEYELEKLPIDVLCGTDRIRLALEEGADISAIEASWQPDLDAFKERRKKYLLY